jgi:KamA family protein
VSIENNTMDDETKKLISWLYEKNYSSEECDVDKKQLSQKLRKLFQKACDKNLTDPILNFFSEITALKNNHNISPEELGILTEDLVKLAKIHESIDEHHVTIGGRLIKAMTIVRDASQRVKTYITEKDDVAPSGIQLWPRIQENIYRIKQVLKISDREWSSYSGQLKYMIDSVEVLSNILDMPASVVQDITRVTKKYRFRVTPYYASLILPEKVNDPVLLQSVPTGEMIDNLGEELPPVAADHSPARLIDQFYPRTVTIKATNMCAMYCTHCLRIAHIGKSDRIYSQQAYTEALDYIRGNKIIRDVLITGGDALALPNKTIAFLLEELDSIAHIKVKRMGTRIPITCPWRIDEELLGILKKSNDKKPIRLVTQINTAQEITPESKRAFKNISYNVSDVMNQAVLLKGVNDSKTKMFKLCETIQEAYVRPYYVFNCSFRNPQFAHMRVPVSRGREIIESMYGNISGDAIPRYIATAGGKIPLHKDNVAKKSRNNIVLTKPWNGEQVNYPDANEEEYASLFAFENYKL